MCIPTTTVCKRVAGWNDSARLLKRQASFWHQLWVDCGSPSAGVTAEIKKKTKQRYKAETRRLKRQQNYICREKMGSALAANHTRNFWSEVKRINRSKCASPTAPMIDGVSGDPHIAELWSVKFKDLYNCCDPNKRTKVLEEVNSSVTTQDLASLSVDINTVLGAIDQLKPGKSDGKSLISDHVLNAPPILASKLAELFTLLRHGYAAVCLWDSIIQPIPKGAKDPAKSCNYRGIALASCLGKLLELYILQLFPKFFNTSRLQFGFKKGCSTDLCTGLLKIVSSHYVQQGSKVRCALLDMSKAFDMVDHGYLFDLLLLRELPYPVLRFLIQWYSHQRLQIRWKGTLSSTFSVANGVQQGGILSPILFTVYIDELLQWLTNIGVGCHWKGMFASCLCYADDLALLAPSAHALRRMLKVCSDFAMERNLMFNAGKTQLICFRRHRSIVNSVGRN